jgi:hypothetical protein
VPQALKGSEVSELDEDSLRSFIEGDRSDTALELLESGERLAVSDAAEESEKKSVMLSIVPEKMPMMAAPSRFCEWPGFGTSAK